MFKMPALGAVHLMLMMPNEIVPVPDQTPILDVTTQPCRKEAKLELGPSIDEGGRLSSPQELL